MGLFSGTYFLNSEYWYAEDFNNSILIRSVVFPNRAGRVILDGIVNPVLWTATAPYKFLPGKCVTSRLREATQEYDY